MRARFSFRSFVLYSSATFSFCSTTYLAETVETSVDGLLTWFVQLGVVGPSFEHSIFFMRFPMLNGDQIYLQYKENGGENQFQNKLEKKTRLGLTIKVS